MATIAMLAREGLGALAGAWRYQCFRTEYDQGRSVYTIDSSRHAPVSAADFSDCRWESSRTRRDLQITFERDLATLRQWRGLRWRADCLSIRLMVADDIRRGRGGAPRGAGGDLVP